MRLGFVGVGRWAQKLMGAFEAEGATLFAYDRSSKPEYPNLALPFGTYMPWQDMIQSSSVDALVLCAPPEATTEVALACAKAGKPVMATKPLMLTARSVSIRAPFFVDYWRLWSDSFRTLRCKVPQERFRIRMEGSGPIRSFPGLLDYGPHAFAYLRHLLPSSTPEGDDPKIAEVREFKCRQGELFDIEGENERWAIRVGNGANRGMRCIEVYAERGRYTLLDEAENGLLSSANWWNREDKVQALRRMCRSFMNDISEGFVTTEHLDLSCAVMRDLAEVRRLAHGAKP